MTETTVKWMPIETAPKDGTRVMVWPPTYRETVSCARWDPDEHAKRPRPFWYRSDAYGRITVCRENEPTHWAPIISGPVDK